MRHQDWKIQPLPIPGAYFLAKDVGKIKIGMSETSVKTRTWSLSSAHAARLDLLHVVYCVCGEPFCASRMEHRLYRMFEHIVTEEMDRRGKTQFEWFWDQGDIRKFLVECPMSCEDGM